MSETMLRSVLFFEIYIGLRPLTRWLDVTPILIEHDVT